METRSTAACSRTEGILRNQEMELHVTEYTNRRLAQNSALLATNSGAIRPSNEKAAVASIDRKSQFLVMVLILIFCALRGSRFINLTRLSMVIHPSAGKKMKIYGTMLYDKDVPSSI